MRGADRAALLLAVAAVLWPRPAAAQYREPRSSDYLFSATAADARSLWVNPAGLGVLGDASVMGEIVLDRLVDGDLALGQYTAGFNSRGLAFGFRHDRLTDTLSNNTFRIGAGRGMGRLAVGGAFTLHTNGEDPDQRELDVGVRYLLARGLEVGATVQHLGKPQIADSSLALTLRAGFAWRPVRALEVAADAFLADPPTGGLTTAWHAGLRITTGGRLPLGAIAAVALDDEFTAVALTVGVSLGGPRRGVLLGTDRLGDGTTELGALSLTGVAIDAPRGRR